MPLTPEQTFCHLLAFHIVAAVLDTGTGNMLNINKIIATPATQLATNVDLKILAKIDPGVYEQRRTYLTKFPADATEYLRNFVEFETAASDIWTGPEPHP